jgi:hypothetical protein
VKRTAEKRDIRESKFQSPVSRAHDSFFFVYPAINCWAIFDRPLRGLWGSIASLPTYKWVGYFQPSPFADSFIGIHNADRN